MFWLFWLQLRPWRMREVISELCWQTSQPVSCFQLIVKYEFPRAQCTTKVMTSFFTWVISHTCSLTQQRREFHVVYSTLNNPALYVTPNQNAVWGIEMNVTQQKMQIGYRWKRHLRFLGQIRNNAAKQCFLETFDRKNGNRKFTLLHIIVIDWATSPLP